MRRILYLSISVFAVVAAAAVFLTENALHVWNRTIQDSACAEHIAQQAGAVSWRSVDTTAHDGARLQAWLFVPKQPNGAGVILMHGVGDTRVGISGAAPFFLRAGYTVLMPDSRGHGVSAGSLITYGVLEAYDLRRWADLLLREPGVNRLYGFGQSMGAAILLESLAREPRIRAVVADCPFVTFQEIAIDRLSQKGIRSRAVSWPVIQLGFVYARLRYGVDLWQASPAEALRGVHKPVLLIHGLADDNVPPRHSQALHRANPHDTQLWEVPGAGHTASMSLQPAAYQKRVLAWLEANR